jgi:hypothetical protein
MYMPHPSFTCQVVRYVYVRALRTCESVAAHLRGVMTRLPENLYERQSARAH